MKESDKLVYKLAAYAKVPTILLYLPYKIYDDML